MPRPPKQTVDYFPHYADASDRKTLTIIQNKYGNDGYAFWFKLLQLLCKTPGHYIYLQSDADIEFLLAKTHIPDTEIAKNILNTLSLLEAIDPQLYKLGCIWSDNLIQNLSMVYEKRTNPLPSKPVIVDGNLIFSTETAFPPQLSTEMVVSNSDNTQTKLNKTKLNKTNNKKPYGEFKNVLLTDEEKGKLIERFGEPNFGEKVETMSLAIESKGYKYKSHYAAILNWDRKDTEKTNTSDKRPRALPTKYPRPEEL